MTRIHEQRQAVVPQPGAGIAEQRRHMGKPRYGEQPVLTGNRNGILERVRSMLSGNSGGFSLEDEDVLLLVILYLMYRESGDREFLIVLAAMLFL